MMRRLLLAFALVGTTVSCVEQAPEPGHATIQLAMDIPACTPAGNALSGQGVCSFKVSVLAGAWTSLGSRPESLFDAGCVQYGGDVITVGPIESVSNATIYMEFFGDTTCDTPVMYGLRGGVTIEESDTAQGSWFVPTFPVDGFGRFPVLADSTRQAAAATTCSTDADCIAQNGDGSYVLSPLARCTQAGACSLPESLYPLNTFAHRAFHSATALDDGRIVLVGGLGREAGGQYFATDETFETFDPVSMTFNRVDGVEGISGQRLAFHSLVSLGRNKVAIVGGAQKAELSFADASMLGQGKRTLSVNFPDDADNLSPLIYSVDLASNSAQTAPLPSAVIAPHAALVGPNSVLVTGGVSPMAGGGGLAATARADTCDLSGAPSCTTTGTMNIERSGHCGFCRSDEAACSDLLLFGGLHATDAAKIQANIAEAYTPADQTFTPVARNVSGLEGTVAFPGCVRASGANYLVGGAARRNAPPSLPPYVLTEQAGGIGATAVSGTDKLDTPFRVHAAQVALNDGSVLVTGGLSDTGTALNSAYIISGSAVVEAISMNEARFGHTATVLTTGPLAGSVLIAGGFSTDNAGNLTFASGAEIYTPTSR